MSDKIDNGIYSKLLDAFEACLDDAYNKDNMEARDILEKILPLICNAGAAGHNIKEEAEK